MARVKTFTNGGSLLPGDLNSIQDDYEFAFSTYKTIYERYIDGAVGGVTATTYALPATGSPFGAVPITAAVAFYIDPADYTANTRASKYRVRAVLNTNAVAPTSTFTIGLYPVATWGGASGSSPTVATLGAVQAGSTVAIAAPAATSQTQSNSGDFTAPAVGYYVLAAAVTTSMVVNSSVTIRAYLQMRQV